MEAVIPDTAPYLRWTLVLAGASTALSALEALVAERAWPRGAPAVVRGPGLPAAAWASQGLAALALAAGLGGSWRGALAAWVFAVRCAANARGRGVPDGAEQAATLTWAALCLALLVARPGAQAAALVFLGLQCLLAYGTGGVVKLMSRPWRDGQALMLIATTRAHGHRRLAALLRAHPTVASACTRAVVALECALPLLVFLGTGPRLAALVAAASMHVVGAWAMRLGGFAGGFVAMYPSVELLAQCVAAALRGP